MTASPRHLVETTTFLVIDHIKANIEAALARVRTIHNAEVQTNPPESYFWYAEANAMHCPAVFVVPDDFDNRLVEKGSNFINGAVRTFVTVVIEDLVAADLTIKAWRYQAALFEVLDGTQLVSSDEMVKCVVKIMNCRFSPIYTLEGDPPPEDKALRKEISIECEIEHYEKP